MIRRILSMVLLAAFSAPALANAQPAQTDKERCLEENERVKVDKELAASWDAIVKGRPIALIAGQGGFMMGGGLEGAFSDDPDTSLGYSWTAAARAEVMLLSPLWLSGRVRYFPGNGHHLQLDAMAGLNLRSYEKLWISAGSSVTTSGSTTIVSAWNSHCQLRRSDFQFLGGAKILTTAGANKDVKDAMAIQAGVQSMFKNRNVGIWSLTGLYEPFDSAYGGQFTMGVGGAYGTPSWLLMDMTTGFFLGGLSAFWFTIDFGVVFEI